VDLIELIITVNSGKEVSVNDFNVPLNIVGDGDRGADRTLQKRIETWG
jgi:hypothetical protein